MKRSLLMLMGVIALASCAPVQLSLPAVPDPGSAALTIDRQDSQAVVTFAAGSLDAQAVQVTLSGVNLAVNDPNCKAEGAQLVCTLGTVPAGRMYVLPGRGVLVAEAAYQRPDGASYSLISEGAAPPNVTGGSR
ncbi:hypothetical protein GCM10022631_01560 [Deinococcus rubellus]|uniref:SbsA Ig-like domain-containing protein n=1 Tax=Deinococcus rubellus TaxID=1889240 RepID=A0ABY5YIH3_9DEIO|nr:hypothetical protein [Deinococcus rubellus]UWX64736.1 hypothetical protein N0D28_03495 [Deinococcus rubellus]